MSSGGFISSMITSLKNNQLLLRNLKERRHYAISHHAETTHTRPSKRKPIAVSGIVLQAFRKKHKRELRIEKHKLWTVYILTFLMAIFLVIGFYWLLFK